MGGTERALRLPGVCGSQQSAQEQLRSAASSAGRPDQGADPESWFWEEKGEGEGSQTLGNQVRVD